MSGSIDLNQITATREYIVEVKTREDEDERQARIQRDNARTHSQLWRDEWMFRIGSVAVIVVAGVCVWMSMDLSFSADQQKWAQSILTSLITAVLGYLVGRNSQ